MSALWPVSGSGSQLGRMAAARRCRLPARPSAEAWGGAKAAKLRASAQPVERGAGGGGAEGGRDDPGAIGVEGLPLFGDAEAVSVFAFDGHAARVEAEGGFPSVLDGGGGREEVVEAAHEASGGEVAVGEEGGDLALGVDAGVGASGEGDGVAGEVGVAAGGLAGEVADGVFEGALDGGQVGLPLGAGEGCAVVLEAEGDPPHAVGALGHGRVFVLVVLVVAADVVVGLVGGLCSQSGGLNFGAVDEFDVGHAGAVAATGSEFDDPGVSAASVFEAGGDVIEESAQDFAVGEDGGGLSAGVEVAALAERDHAFGEGTDGFGFGFGGDDGVVPEEVGDLVAEECVAVGAAAAERASGFAVSHGAVSCWMV